jgi:hypothetical protein
MVGLFAHLLLCRGSVGHAIGHLGLSSRVSAPRGLERSAVLTLISHSARRRARRLRYLPRAWAPRSLSLARACVRLSPDLKLHMHAAVPALRAPRAIEARGRRAAMRVPGPNPTLRAAAGLRSAAVKLTDAIRLRPMLGKAQIIRHCFMILCACRIVLRLRGSG